MTYQFNTLFDVESADGINLGEPGLDIIKTLFNNKMIGFAYCKVIMDHTNKPVDFIFLEINEAYEIATGLKKENLIGRKITEVIPGIDKNLVDRHTHVAMTGEETHLEVFEPNLKRWYDMNVYSPKKGYFISIVSDISERKLADEVLKRDKESVEKLVNERTEELVKTQIELERSKRLSDIGTLAACIAHELRNPLAAITMAAANIKRKAKNPVLESHLHTIEKKINDSNQIINNLLCYSRIKKPNIETINFCDILNEAIEDAASRNITKKILINNNQDCLRECFIKADPLQLKEVFNNILINAYDAVPDIRGMIDIETKLATGFIEICIKDNGCGINKEDLCKIFNPFFTTKAKGTGLGLAVCYQIVTLHGGTITVKSEIDKGTVVCVKLPK